MYIDEATNKKLFWTVNKRILICMLGTYFCQSLDKGTLGFASIMGIIDDAGLKGQEYSWLGTILYMVCRLRHMLLPLKSWNDNADCDRVFLLESTRPTCSSRNCPLQSIFPETSFAGAS